MVAGVAAWAKTTTTTTTNSPAFWQRPRLEGGAEPAASCAVGMSTAKRLVLSLRGRKNSQGNSATSSTRLVSAGTSPGHELDEIAVVSGTGSTSQHFSYGGCIGNNNDAISAAAVACYSTGKLNTYMHRYIRCTINIYIYKTYTHAQPSYPTAAPVHPQQMKCLSTFRNSSSNPMHNAVKPPISEL